jgi:hypothetical protein
MIDIQPIVFSAIYDAVGDQATVSNVEQMAPESFPYVTVQEISNTTYTRSQDDSLREHQAKLGYVINVYSTESDTEARYLMSLVDNTMQDMKFTRTQLRPTPNIDHTVHRYTATYEAVVAEPITVDGDTVYQMYRR